METSCDPLVRSNRKRGALIGVGVGILFARLLGPETIGIYAIATFVVPQNSSYSHFGIASVLGQREAAINDRHLRIGFTAIAAIEICETASFQAVSLERLCGVSNPDEVLWWGGSSSPPPRGAPVSAPGDG